MAFQSSAGPTEVDPLGSGNPGAGAERPLSPAGCPPSDTRGGEPLHQGRRLDRHLGQPRPDGRGGGPLIRRPREAIHVETPATPLKLGGRAGRLIFRLVLEDRVAVGVRCEGYAEVPEQSLHQPEVAVWSLPARRTGR